MCSDHLDNSLMPYGKYKGKKMANIPASYLLWMYRNDKLFKALEVYVEENMDALEKEEKEEFSKREQDSTK